MFWEKAKSSYRFEAKSSSTGEIYEIIAGPGAVITCTCPAAKNGTHCWHRLTILTGKGKNISAGVENLQNAAALFAGSKALQVVMQIDQLEIEKADIAKQIAAAKTQLAHIMLGA